LDWFVQSAKNMGYSCGVTAQKKDTNFTCSLDSTPVLSKTWRKDRCFEGIIQTSLTVMTPN